MKFGAHMSVAGGVHKAFAHAETVRATSLQIFVKNASQWRGKPIDAEEVARFDAERDRTGVADVVAHASYLINLGSPDAKLWRRSIAALVDELERCDRLRLDGLVAHPGSHVGTGEEAGLERIAAGLDEVFATIPGGRTPVLLETTAGQGTNLGWRFEHLARLRELVGDPGRVAYCLDTCHVFAAGYDLRTPVAVAATLDTFDRVCGLGRLRAIHLNDSLKPFESRRDRHAHLGEGEIGRGGFAALVREPRLAGVPFLLETPKGDSLIEDARNLDVVRALAAGREPPDAPPPDTEEWKKGTLAGAEEIARERAEARKEKKKESG